MSEKCSDHIVLFVEKVERKRDIIMKEKNTLVGKKFNPVFDSAPDQVLRFRARSHMNFRVSVYTDYLSFCDNVYMSRKYFRCRL